MTEISSIEPEVAQLIIDALNLEDVEVGEIGPEEPLFREGLGLDSIDALELALAVSKKYGFQLKSDDSNNAKIFFSLRSLSNHIESSRTDK